MCYSIDGWSEAAVVPGTRRFSPDTRPLLRSGTVSIDELTTVVGILLLSFVLKYLEHASGDAWNATKRRFKKKRRRK